MSELFSPATDEWRSSESESYTPDFPRVVHYIAYIDEPRLIDRKRAQAIIRHANNKYP
jgi:hypothetical protein